MALKLPDSAVPMGDFPVAKAVDIDFNDGENLQEKLDNGKLGGGGNTTDLTDLENRVTTNETNITGLQEQIDNLDIPEDVDLTEVNNRLSKLETKRVYNSIEELNEVKGLSLIFTNGEDNTIKIINALSPVETFADYFDNSSNNNRFGIDTVTYGAGIRCLIITKFNNFNACARAYMSSGKILIRQYANGTLQTGWSYDKTDLTGMNTKLTQLENKANFIPIVADNPTDYDLNNYKENGNYGIGDSSKYSNVPISRPGLLTVIRSTSYRLQIYTVVNNDDVYFRKSTNGGNSWSSWLLLNGKVDLTPINTKLIQLENTVNQVGGGGIYTSGEVEVGKWINGQTLYRTTLAADKSMTITSTSQGEFESLILGNINPSKYRVVKMEGSFKYKVNNSNSKTCILPCAFADNDMVMNMVHSSTTGDVILQGKNMPVCDITDIYVSIYYYKN